VPRKVTEHGHNPMRFESKTAAITVAGCGIGVAMATRCMGAHPRERRSAFPATMAFARCHGEPPEMAVPAVFGAETRRGRFPGHFPALPVFHDLQLSKMPAHPGTGAGARFSGRVLGTPAGIVKPAIPTNPAKPVVLVAGDRSSTVSGMVLAVGRCGV